MSQANVDLEKLQKNKIIDGIYARDSLEFLVVTLDAPSLQCGGMALFYKESPRFLVEYYRQHVPNIIRFQRVTGGQRWHVVV